MLSKFCRDQSGVFALVVAIIFMALGTVLASYILGSDGIITQDAEEVDNGMVSGSVTNAIQEIADDE
jgi:Flp pilus assembly protein TadG